MTVVTCRSVHYSFDPKVGSLCMSVVLTWLNSRLGSHSVYWVGLHWTAIFVRMLRSAQVGCSRLQYSTGLRSIPCLNQSTTTQQLSKIHSIERLDNGDQRTVTACRQLAGCYRSAIYIGRLRSTTTDISQDVWCMAENRTGDVMNTSQNGSCLVSLYCSNVQITIPWYFMYQDVTLYILSYTAKYLERMTWFRQCCMGCRLPATNDDRPIASRCNKTALPSCSTQTSARRSLHMKCCKVTAIFKQDILAVFETYAYKEKKHDYGLSYVWKQLHISAIRM